MSGNTQPESAAKVEEIALRIAMEMFGEDWPNAVGKLEEMLRPYIPSQPPIVSSTQVLGCECKDPFPSPYVKQIELDKLQTQLEEFGKKLTVEQCEEFRQIIWSIGVLHNSIGDIYKYAELSLIPRDKPIANGNNVVSTTLPSATNFKPPAKQSLADLTMTLARNLELNLKKE